MRLRKILGMTLVECLAAVLLGVFPIIAIAEVTFVPRVDPTGPIIVTPPTQQTAAQPIVCPKAAQAGPTAATTACGRRFELAPGQSFSCTLPTPGASVWESPSIFPPGLSIVQSGGVWSLQGTLAQDAPLVIRRVNLRVPGQPDLSRQITFDVRIPFSIWTQNAFLLPPTIISLDEVIELSLINPALGAVAGAVKIAYDNSVNNTDDDNSERTNGIAGRLRFFDIVALQEVWNDGPKDQLRAAIGDAYYLLPGPPASEDLPILDIPTDSGLLLLVRKCMAAEGDLAGVTAYSSELRLNHKEESFNETGGIFSADGWAAKGVTLDRIRLGSDHDHFVQVINTHTLAGTDTVVRASQLQQIRDFMNLHVDFSHPVILMGDLNIAEQLVGGNATMPLPGSEYESMFSNLLHFPVLGDLINVFGPPDPDQRFTDDTFRNAYARNWGDGVAIRERLDYILVRQHQNDPTTGATISIRYKIVDLLRPATVLLTDFGFLTQTCVTEGWLPDPLAPDLRCYLSDHFGIEAHLTFSETNEVPVADAGPDQTHSLSRFIISSPVTLNGTASRDPDGSPSPLTFAWTQTAGPAAILVGANTATLSFTPAVAETYKFSLVVSDGRASGSDDAIVTVTPPPFPILVDLQLPPAQPAPKPCPPFLLFCFNP